MSVAALVARLLGVVQRVPLQHLLDDTGMATYGIAYNLYFMLLIVAVAGMPTALSKRVGEHLAQGNLAAAEQSYRMAIRFALVAGFVLAIVMFIGAEWYANAVMVPEAKLAIWMVAPAMLLFPVIAMMRGWYQGHRYAMPSGTSQIVEQIFRVSSTIALAYCGVMLGLSEGQIVAWAAFGGVIGGLGALWILMRARKSVLPIQEKALEEVRSHSETQLDIQTRTQTQKPVKTGYWDMLKLSVPVSIAALAVPMMYFLDSSLIIPLLEPLESYIKAKSIVGIITARAQTLAALPPILAVALSASVVPIISAAMARGDQSGLRENASQALRLAYLAALPLVIWLTVATPQINSLIFGNGNGNTIIMIMIMGSIFQIAMTVSNGILNGLGQTTIPMIHVLIGIAIKMAGSILLVKWFGIYGIIAATMLAFLVITQLNHLRLKKWIVLPKWGTDMYRLWGYSIVIGISGYFLTSYLNETPFTQWVWLNLLISLLIVSIWVGLFYLIVLLRGRVIRRSEWERFPSKMRAYLSRFYLAA